MTALMPGSPVKVLLVDDLEENLVALEALLRRSDLELLQAHNGREALELLLVHDVALALVDVQMPEIDGFELAELMRGSERTRHVPIIFVTAGARDPQRIFRGYDAGAVDFLFKPIDARALRNKTHTFVQLYRQRQQLAEQLELQRRAQAEREQLLGELTETLRLNETFMAVLGHDLRTPLGVVITTAELLLHREEPQVRKAAERLKLTGSRMARMVSELLDLARSRLGGGIPVNVQELDLARLTHRVTEELKLVHPGRQLDVRVEGDLRGLWDEDRLSQVLSNLMSNALQHGAAGAPITVRLDGKAPSDVVLSVSNGGMIPAELLPWLFDPFSSAKEPRRNPDGLGLGLYIVQQIAVAHGGSVYVESSAEVTTITVRLPRAEAGAGAGSASRRPLESGEQAAAPNARQAPTSAR